MEDPTMPEKSIYLAPDSQSIGDGPRLKLSNKLGGIMPVQPTYNQRSCAMWDHGFAATKLRRLFPLSAIGTSGA